MLKHAFSLSLCSLILFVFLTGLSYSSKAQGNAMSFDGNGDYLTSPLIGIPLKEKTFEAWVKLNNLVQFGGGVIGFEVGDGQTHIAFDAIVYNETNQGWGFGSEFFVRTNAWSGVKETSTNDWVHIAATWADNSFKLYRNGVLIQEITDFNTYSFPPNSRILVGQRHFAAGGNDLNAVVDEARVWNYVRSQAEIQASMNCSCAESRAIPQAGLIACYSFDSFGSDPVMDDSGNGFDADINGNPFYLASTAPITPCAPAVPTLGEWGLILLSLLLLVFGTLALRLHSQQGAEGKMLSLFQYKDWPFDKIAFTKSLLLISIATIIGFGMAFFFFGYAFNWADVPGTVVCVPLAAFLGQLLLGAKEEKRSQIS